MVRVGLSPDGTSLLVRFEYHPALVELTKRLPGRRFNRTLGGWLVPLTKELVNELPSRFPGASLTVLPEVHAKVAGLDAEEKAAIALKSWDGKVELPQGMIFPTTQPRHHQEVGLSLLVKRPRFALFMEQGTGKTFVILSTLRWLKACGVGSPSLIVAPASVLHVWEDQAARHQPELKVKALMETIADRKELLRQALLDGTDLVLINYEATWRMEDELQKVAWRCIVLDESTRIKGRTTKQAKAIIKLGARIPRRYILTGTPMPNNPLELFSQFLFLDPTILGHHFYAFRDRYAVMGGYQGYQVVSYKNTHELVDKISKHSYRVLKKECLDLPDKVYCPMRLDLEGDQKTAYDQLKEDLITSIGDSQVTTPVLVSKLVKLREILTGFVKLDTGELHRFKNNVKLKALMDVLEEIPTNHKVVIWCIFREEMRIVEEAVRAGYPGDKVLSLHGEVGMEERASMLREFQSESKTRFFIGQQKAGGVGIELFAADYCIFMTNDYSPETRIQAEDRLHRLGQVNKVTYYDFLCKGTLDVAVMAALRRKQRLSDLLTGSNFQQMLEGSDDA